MGTKVAHFLNYLVIFFENLCIWQVFSAFLHSSLRKFGFYVVKSYLCRKFAHTGTYAAGARIKRKKKNMSKVMIIRQVLNLIFMVLAVVGMIVYWKADNELTGTLILVTAVFFKMAESVLRMMKRRTEKSEGLMAKRRRFAAEADADVDADSENDVDSDIDSDEKAAAE